MLVMIFHYLFCYSVPLTDIYLYYFFISPFQLKEIIEELKENKSLKVAILKSEVPGRFYF